MDVGPNTRLRRATRSAVSGSRPAAACMSKALSSRILRVAVMTSFEPADAFLEASRTPLTSSLDQSVSIVQFFPNHFGTAAARPCGPRAGCGAFLQNALRRRYYSLYSGFSNVD